MRELSLLKGNIAEAKKRYDEALSLSKQLGEKANTAEIQVALAAVALEEGHPSEAQTMIREAQEDFRKQKLRDDEILSDALLSEALLASGNLAAARSQADAMALFAANSRATRYDYGRVLSLRAFRRPPAENRKSRSQRNACAL
jgi:hypothetical protein